MVTGITTALILIGLGLLLMLSRRWIENRFQRLEKRKGFWNKPISFAEYKTIGATGLFYLGLALLLIALYILLRTLVGV